MKKKHTQKKSANRGSIKVSHFKSDKNKMTEPYTGQKLGKQYRTTHK